MFMLDLKTMNLNFIGNSSGTVAFKQFIGRHVRLIHASVHMFASTTAGGSYVGLWHSRKAEASLDFGLGSSSVAMVVSTASTFVNEEIPLYGMPAKERGMLAMIQCPGGAMSAWIQIQYVSEV